MKYDKDDPRLIDYVLGELEEAERVEIEQALAEDEALRNAVEEYREAVKTTSNVLHSETADTLTDEQRGNIIEQSERKTKHRPRLRPRLVSTTDKQNRENHRHPVKLRTKQSDKRNI